jgi:acyl-CoA synthetase (AMP-forming)/AMP-acid ligase II
MWQQIEPLHCAPVYRACLAEAPGRERGRIRYSLNAVSDIVQRFAKIAVDQPERPLIYSPASSVALSASQVWQSHLELREHLSALGIQPGQLVISGAGNRPAGIPLLLACLSLGAPLMPIDAGATATDVADSAARFGAFALALPQGPELRVKRAHADPITYADVALLKLTSGSTGFPKAILTRESHLIADGERIIGAMGIAPSDTQLAVIPLSHSYGFGNLMMPLLLQGTAIALRDSFVPSQVLLDAQAFQSRVCAGVPYMFNFLAANSAAGGWPPCLQLLISAGARLEEQTSHAFHDRFGIKIHSFYGASETGGIAYDASDMLMPEGHVGTAMPGVTILVRPDEEAAAGSGRIFVRSDSVAAGYTEDENESNFVDGGFLTGDLGSTDTLGHLTLTGRASAAVNVAGRKVHPAEVERVLRDMNGVEDVCVIAAPDARRGQQILACIVSRHISSALEVRRFCASRLAPHKVPRAIIFLPSLPLTPRGKIDRERLLSLALERVKDEGG